MSFLQPLLHMYVHQCLSYNDDRGLACILKITSFIFLGLLPSILCQIIYILALVVRSYVTINNAHQKRPQTSLGDRHGPGESKRLPVLEQNRLQREGNAVSHNPFRERTQVSQATYTLSIDFDVPRHYKRLNFFYNCLLY